MHGERHKESGEHRRKTADTQAVESDICARAEHRRRDINLMTKKNRRYVAERIAKNSYRASRGRLWIRPWPRLGQPRISSRVKVARYQLVTFGPAVPSRLFEQYRRTICESRDDTCGRIAQILMAVFVDPVRGHYARR